MSRKLDGDWGTECHNTTFLLLVLLCEKKLEAVSVSNRRRELSYIFNYSLKFLIINNIKD